MRFLPSLFLALLTLFPFSAQAGFTDVSSSHQYADAIEFVSSQGIIVGKNGIFRPEEGLNRAELIKIVVASRYDEATIEKCIRAYQDRNWWYVRFKDVPTDSWYGPYVCVAFEAGIIKGYPDGNLRPNQIVNFVEAGKILLGTLGISGDGGAVPWYKPFVEELAARGAIPTSVDRFDSAIKRAEFAEIVYRLLKNIDYKTSKTYADLVPPEPIPCNNCLVIPNLKIQVPIIFGVGVDALSNKDWETLENELLTALRDGVVHYPGTARPGEEGNVFVTGHSSYYRSDPGAYKEVFARLPDLKIGDTYTIYYQGKKYLYQIFEEKIVQPEDVHVLDQTPIEERSSLMTCWPRYTNQQRKIFTARRIE